MFLEFRFKTVCRAFIFFRLVPANGQTVRVKSLLEMENFFRNQYKIDRHENYDDFLTEMSKNMEEVSNAFAKNWDRCLCIDERNLQDHSQ